MTRLIIALALLGGCATTQTLDAFSYRFADNRLEDLEPILPSAGASNETEAPIVVATTDGETPELVAIELPTGTVRWRVPFTAFTRPEILGDVVMTSEREAVVALDLGTGQELWRKPLGELDYVGAARLGNSIFWVHSIGAGGGANRAGRVEAVDARSGRRRWGHAISGTLGKPAASGEYLFVPWDKQNIAILRTLDGTEAARLRTNDDIIAWIERRPEGIYYGHRNIYRLGAGSATGNREDAVHRSHPIPDLPRDPEVHEDGFLPVPGRRSARGRIRVYASPAASDTAVPLRGQRAYYVYFRYVFAYDEEGSIVWARMLDQEVLNAQPLQDGLFLVGGNGALLYLDSETGTLRYSASIDTPLASAGLQVEDFSAGASEEAATPLRTALATIAGDADNRLVPARAHAVSLLAAMDEPEITQDLLDLYVQRSTPGALREAIREAVRTRAVGTEFLVSALDQHFDYLDQTPVPPLDLIVPALRAQNVSDAVPGLIEHLRDHETPAAALPAIADAIRELGDAAVAPSLRTFLVRYRADSTFIESPEVIASVANGTLAHGGDEGRTLLQEVAAAPLTRQPFRDAVQGLFDREVSEAEARAQAEAEAAAQAAAAAAAAERAARPQRLSQRQINETFVAETEALRVCVEEELERNPRLGQLRFVFIIENTGRPQDMRVTPASEPLQACLAPTLEALTFPRFLDRRQRASFTINLRARSEEPTASEVEDGPWWARNQRRGGQAEGALGRPWWQPRVVAAPTVPDAPEAPETPETPEAPETPETPETPEAPPEELPPPDAPAGEGDIWWLPSE